MWLIIGGAAVVVIALVVWVLLTRGATPTPPPYSPPTTQTHTPQPTATVTPDPWDGPITLNASGRLALVDVDLTDIALFQNNGFSTTEVTAIELSTRTQLWQAEFDSLSDIFGDDTGLVMVSLMAVQVVDPRTGEVTAQADDVDVVQWAGHGAIVTTGQEMCVRTMKKPGTCAWTAAGDPLSLSQFDQAEHVFGNGQWVNTSKGVRNLATGKRASFGADAGVNYPELVYYTGEPDRVFRVATTGATLADATFQPWDTQTNTAISPPVTANYIVASPELPVYIAVSSGDTPGKGSSTAFQWATGEQLWRTPNFSTPHWPAQFVGDVYLQQSLDEDGFPTAETLNPETGEQIWQYPEEIGTELIGIIDTVLYVGMITAAGYDLADASKEPLQIESPDFDCVMQVVAGHMVAYGISSGEVYVLNR